MSTYPRATGPVYLSAETSILEDPYQKEVLLDNWQFERKKTKYALFSIALVYLVASIIGYM